MQTQLASLMFNRLCLMFLIDSDRYLLNESRQLLNSYTTVCLVDDLKKARSCISFANVRVPFVSLLKLLMHAGYSCLTIQQVRLI